MPPGIATADLGVVDAPVQARALGWQIGGLDPRSLEARRLRRGVANSTSSAGPG